MRFAAVIVLIMLAACRPSGLEVTATVQAATAPGSVTISGTAGRGNAVFGSHAAERDGQRPAR